MACGVHGVHGRLLVPLPQLCFVHAVVCTAGLMVMLVMLAMMAMMVLVLGVSVPHATALAQ